MNTDELQRPLSKAELEEIHAILEHDAAGLVPAALDGFLTAVGSAPTGFAPSAWLPMIFGEFEFEDQGDFSRFAGLVLRRYNEVLRRTGDPDSVWPPSSLGEDKVIAWCGGYMQLARLDPKWLRDEWAFTQLFSIAVLAGEHEMVGGEDKDGNIIEDASPFLIAFRRLLPKTVSDLDDYWRERRQMDLQRPSPPHLGQDGPQRALPLRQRAEVQEVLRAGRVSGMALISTRPRVWRGRPQFPEPAPS